MQAIQVKKPKKKLSYYLILMASLIFAMAVSSEQTKWINEIMFGILLLCVLRFIYDSITNSRIPQFSLETHYDKFSSILIALFGVLMIVMSFMNPDFFVRFNLEWINFMLGGIFSIFIAFPFGKSLRFNSKSTDHIEIDDYDLSLDSEIKLIEFFTNKILIHKTKDEVYQFNDLSLKERDATNFSQWLEKNLSNSNIEVTWKT